ncbi:MAG: hypothetical protein PWP23_2232 [Candidatus Sumerlaeota bacterium]|nr:hypothetical protein [Candidatus Sumerlaeota bacterium]
MKIDPKDGRVYRIHVSGGTNNLSMLICVFAPDPHEVLDKYLHHAAVVSLSEPVLVPTMDGNSKGIDVFITPQDRAPGYQILNRLKLHPIDRTLISAD